MADLAFIRYWLAFLILASHLPSLLLWLAIHPFSDFWRTLGGKGTFLILAVPVLAWITGVWLLRGYLMGFDCGVNGATMALGVISFTAALWLRRERMRQLGPTKISGFAEISRERYPGALLTDGIYGRIRHPRYIEMLLLALGYSLIANYSGPYIAWWISLPVLYLVVILEERELLQRFGPAYEEYCRRVPRFIPRPGGANPAGPGGNSVYHP